VGEALVVLVVPVAEGGGVVAPLAGWWEGGPLVVVVVVVDMVDMVMTVVFVVRVGGGDVRRYTVGRGWFCREEADAESE
jgi:hypothetical protein